MKDSVYQHLVMIQGVVSRMSTNSFLVKGWVVTLVAAIIALSTKDSNPAFILIAYIPIPIFWCLDTYYLYLEKSFRALYDRVRQGDASDFSMSLNQLEQSEKPNFWRVLTSKTILPLYLVLIFSVYLVSILVIK